ncbi:MULTISPECIES: hypothetical protein [Exiguobacterium]|uniref:hypothetical protein n=1 Tax=Exiguobacterium TaxID=33986 RepID=UPI00047BAD94|nr:MULTISPECIES: hypothetical protein [Exiguobacterium]
MNRDRRIRKDFESYQNFLNEYFPKFNSIEEDLYDFYSYVNNTFVLCDLLIEHNKVDKSNNYFNLIIEYREFYARLLTTVAINDKFLIENILRIIIEKIYRILFGILKDKKIERTIRKESREKMKKILEGTIEISRFESLNNLYNDYSQKVHHTDSVPTDYYDLTKRLEYKEHSLREFIKSMEKIEKIFLHEVFLVLSPDSEKEETSYRMKIRNNTSDYIINTLNLN